MLTLIRVWMYYNFF